MSLVGQTLHSAPPDSQAGGKRAYTGQILRVNLSTGALWVDRPDEAFYRTHLGGRGVILHYLLSAMPAGADPLGPENLLIFAPGLVTGTVLPGSGRHAAGAKSPLTGALGSSEAGGWWGTELKRAGFDAVVIQGQAEQPVYLWIRDGTVEIRDARPYWGMLTGPAQTALREALGDSKVRVAQIGPGGENLVRYASVMHDVGRAAGRSGLGAVMGSKRLKAIAVRGTRPIELADEGRLAETLHWILGGYKEMMGWAISRGTEGSVKFNHDAGGTGVRNYLDGALPGIEKLDGDNLFSFLVKRRDTCYRCPVQCKPVAEYQSEALRIDGQYGGPEYETIGGFGPLCGVSDPLAVAKANELCAAYGLDTISTGGTLAFAMECAEAGDLAGYEPSAPRFGDGATLVENIHRIARREGLGDLLAEGSARVAKKLGLVAQDRLGVARGQEFPLHDPRLKNTLALGYALSPTGADHMHNLNDTFANWEGSDTCARLREMGFSAPLPLWGFGPEKLQALIYETAFKHVMDSAVVCQFYPYEYRHMAAALSAAGGWDVTPAEIHAIGLRITHEARRFLLREGFTHADDKLSARAYQKLTSGPIAGKALTPDELEAAMQAYFKLVGWDQNGVPPQG